MGIKASFRGCLLAGKQRVLVVTAVLAWERGPQWSPALVSANARAEQEPRLQGPLEKPSSDSSTFAGVLTHEW